MRLNLNSKGQSLVEYMIIVAIMAIGSMGIIRVLNHTTQAKFAKITQSLQGGKASVSIEYEKVKDRHFKKKDMATFFPWLPISTK